MVVVDLSGRDSGLIFAAAAPLRMSVFDRLYGLTIRATSLALQGRHFRCKRQDGRRRGCEEGRQYRLPRIPLA